MKKTNKLKEDIERMVKDSFEEKENAKKQEIEDDIVVIKRAIEKLPKNINPILDHEDLDKDSTITMVEELFSYLICEFERDYNQLLSRFHEIGNIIKEYDDFSFKFIRWIKFSSFVANDSNCSGFMQKILFDLKIGNYLKVLLNLKQKEISLSEAADLMLISEEDMSKVFDAIYADELKSNNPGS